MTRFRRPDKATLKRKTAALAATLCAAFALSAALLLIGGALSAFFPADAARILSAARTALENPETARACLARKGNAAPLFFIAAQVLQVFIAPIPGQAVALAGGYAFGFGKGLMLTMLGLTLGSAAAMATSRLLGEKFVRRFVPESAVSRFDGLIESGGYSQFFMIFLLPALPDDAVCFIAGLTRLRLLPLTLVCLLGRAPGMAVLSLVGAQAALGLTWQVKALFAGAMALSAAVWLFTDL